MGSECGIGKNGCETLQDLTVEIGKMKVQQKNDGKDIVDIWKVVGDIRSLLFKAVLGMAVLTTIVQVAFKFWH